MILEGNAAYPDSHRAYHRVLSSLGFVSHTKPRRSNCKAEAARTPRLVRLSYLQKEHKALYEYHVFALDVIVQSDSDSDVSVTSKNETEKR